MIYLWYVKPFQLLDLKKIITSNIIILLNIRENMLYFELIDILRSPEIVKIMTGTWTVELK